MKGSRQVKEGKTNDLSAFEWGMVVSARCTGLFQKLQCWWVFTLKSFLWVSWMVHHPKAFQSIWHNCGKHWSQYGPASAFRPYRACPDEFSPFWGQNGGCNSIFARCSAFSRLQSAEAGFRAWGGVTDTVISYWPDMLDKQPEHQISNTKIWCR